MKKENIVHMESLTQITPQNAQTELITGLEKLLRGRNRETALHWTADILPAFTCEDKSNPQKNYSTSEVIQAMNTILLPHGNFRGENHLFWDQSIHAMLETSKKMFRGK